MRQFLKIGVAFLFATWIWVLPSCAKTHRREGDKDAVRDRGEIRIENQGGAAGEATPSVGGLGGFGGVVDTGQGGVLAGVEEIAGTNGESGVENGAGEAGQENLIAGSGGFPLGGFAGDANEGGQGGNILGGFEGFAGSHSGGSGGEVPQLLVPRNRTASNGYLGYCLPTTMETEACGSQYALMPEPILVHPNHWQIQGCFGASVGAQNTCREEDLEYSSIIRWVAPNDGDYVFDWSPNDRNFSFAIRSTCDDTRAEIICKESREPPRGESREIKDSVAELRNVQQGQTFYLIFGGVIPSPSNKAINIYHANADTPPEIENALIRTVSSLSSYETYASDEYEDHVDLTFRYYFLVRDESRIPIKSFSLEFLDVQTNTPIPLAIANGQTRIEYPIEGRFERSIYYRRQGSPYLTQEVPEYPHIERRGLSYKLLRLPLEVRGGRSSQALLKVKNKAGIESVAYPIQISPQATVDPGERCDPNDLIDRCTEGSCRVSEEEPNAIYTCVIFNEEQNEPIPLTVQNIQVHHNEHHASVVIGGSPGRGIAYDLRLTFYRSNGSILQSKSGYFNPNSNIVDQGIYQRASVFDDRRFEELDHVRIEIFEMRTWEGNFVPEELQVVESEPFPIVQEGEFCDPEAALNECELHTVCKEQINDLGQTESRCVLQLAPQVESVELLRDESFKLYATISVTDTDRDVVGLRIRAQKEFDDLSIEQINATYYPDHVVAIDENQLEMSAEIVETEGAARLANIEFQAIDAQGIESEWVEIDEASIQERAVVEFNVSCDPKAILDMCAEGFTCRENSEDSGYVCKPEELEEFEIQGTEAFLDVNKGTFKLRVRTTNPYFNVRKFYFTWQGAGFPENARVPYDEIPRDNQETLTFDHIGLHPEGISPHDRLGEIFIQISHYPYSNQVEEDGRTIYVPMTPERWKTAEAIELVLIDDAGNETAPFRVPVVQPELVEQGGACELEHEITQCEQSTVCAALADGENPVCQDAAVFSECPYDWLIGDLTHAEVEAPDEPEGVYWLVTENANGNFSPHPSPNVGSYGSCNPENRVERQLPHIYLFTAPMAGTYRWSTDAIRTDGQLQDIIQNLSVRTHCAAPETELACMYYLNPNRAEDRIYYLDHLEVEAELQAGQTVYIFVETSNGYPYEFEESIDTAYALSVHYLGL